MPTVPPGRPKATREQLLSAVAKHYQIEREHHPFIVIGIRGYFRDTMGEEEVNDRGIYDDAIFIDSPHASVAYNGNTDPAIYRKGYGFKESTKGVAVLKPGLYYAHKFDFHKGEYRALCQRLGPVTVIRDGNPPYEDTGSDFGINIHRGGINGTSSIGCQTIPPEQWGSFISLAEDLAKRYHGDDWDDVVIPYVLLDNADNEIFGTPPAPLPAIPPAIAMPASVKPTTGEAASGGRFLETTNLKTTVSPVTAKSIDEFFAKQPVKNRSLQGIGTAVMAASEKYGIHAAYIVAHAILETGWGTAKIYKEKNNLFGWGAFDDSPYESAGKFPSREDCIDFVLGRINSLYLTSGAKYYHTAPCVGAGYGSAGYGMNRYYSTDPDWGPQIASIVRRIEQA